MPAAQAIPLSVYAPEELDVVVFPLNETDAPETAVPIRRLRTVPVSVPVLEEEP